MLVVLDDIYAIVEEPLFQSGFCEKESKEQKQLVEVKLAEYLAQKIVAAKANDILHSKAKKTGNGEELTVAIEAKYDPNNPMYIEDLVTELGNLIPEKEHSDTISHLTHFILDVAGAMQENCMIFWDLSDEDEFYDNPAPEFQDGMWHSVTTHKKQSYVETFKRVYGIFKDTFKVKSTVPQLTKVDKPM